MRDSEFGSSSSAVLRMEHGELEKSRRRLMTFWKLEATSLMLGHRLGHNSPQRGTGRIRRELLSEMVQRSARDFSGDPIAFRMLLSLLLPLLRQFVILVCGSAVIRLRSYSARSSS